MSFCLKVKKRAGEEFLAARSEKKNAIYCHRMGNRHDGCTMKRALSAGHYTKSHLYPWLENCCCHRLMSCNNATIWGRKGPIDSAASMPSGNIDGGGGGGGCFSKRSMIWSTKTACEAFKNQSNKVNYLVALPNMSSITHHHHHVIYNVVNVIMVIDASCATTIATFACCLKLLEVFNLRGGSFCASL